MGSVLIEQENRLPGGSDPTTQTGRLDLHQRDQPMDFRLGRDELGQDSAQAERLLAQRRPNEVLAGSRGIPLVEDQVDHLEDRRKARRALGSVRDLEPRVCFGERPLRPDDALSDGRHRGQEPPRDLLGRQAAEHAKGERDPGILR